MHGPDRYVRVEGPADRNGGLNPPPYRRDRAAGIRRACAGCLWWHCEPETAPEPPPEETPGTGEREEDQTPEQTPERDGGAGEGTGRDDEAPPPEREGTDPVPDADLPGEEFDMFFNDEGAAVHVVGVEDADVLFVRALPDHTAQEVGRLAPTGEATLAGQERNVENGLWAEVELADGVGWVNSSYLGYLAEPGEDITEEFSYPAQDDPMAIVGDIAQTRVDLVAGESQVPDGILVQTPQDSPVYRVDVIPFFDDATYGERLEIHIEETAEGYQVGEVRSVRIYSRGLTDDGLCV